MPDAAYDRVGSDYGRGKIEFPNEQFIEDYRKGELQPDAYDDFMTCPSGVWFAAIAHYFMIAVMSWMACEGIHLYFQVVAVLSRPRHKYLTKLSLFGWGLPIPLSITALLVEKFGTKHNGFTLRFSNLDFAGETVTGPNIVYYVWLDYNLFLGTVVVPYAIMFFFNTIMFGMVMAALINTRNPLLKSFKRISSTLSRHNSSADRKASQKHSKVLDTRRTVQGAIGLMVVLGCAIILMFMMFNAESGSETIAWFFIIFNGLQGFWIFLFHTALKDDVLPVLICPKRVQNRKLRKRPSFPTDTETIGTHSPASGKNSNEDFFPTGLAYASNNKIKHSNTEYHHTRTKQNLQFTKSLPPMPTQQRPSPNIRRQVQFEPKP